MPESYRGAMWMVSYALVYSLMVGVARHLSDHFSAFEIVFFRALVATVAILPWVLATGVIRLRTEKASKHLQRAVLGFGAQATWFYSIALIPLGQAVAVQFTLPLLTVLASAAYLGERVTRERWIATAIGFAGMLVIVRPGLAEWSFGLGSALISAVLYAGATVTAKELSRTETNTAVVFYINVLMLPLAAFPAVVTWHGVEMHHIPWLLMLGLFGIAANFCLAKSFAAADASAVIPIDFLRLPFSAWIGLTWFGQTTDIWTWIGAAVIASGCYYLAAREKSRVARAATNSGAGIRGAPRSGSDRVDRGHGRLHGTNANRLDEEG